MVSGRASFEIYYEFYCEEIISRGNRKKGHSRSTLRPAWKLLFWDDDDGMTMVMMMIHGKKLIALYVLCFLDHCYPVYCGNALNSARN